MVYQPIPQFIPKDRLNRKTQSVESLTAHTLVNDSHPRYIKKSSTPGTLTVASGVVAIYTAKRYYTLAGEGGAADNLDTINGGIDGYEIILRAVNTAVTITVKHGTGNIYLNAAADFALDNSADTLHLLYDKSLAKWLEIGRADGGI